jgi:hypothetical protein
VNDFNTAWVYTDKYGSVSLTVGYHGARWNTTKTMMEKAESEGVTWTVDLPELMRLGEVEGIVDQLSQGTMVKFASSPVVDCGKNKTVQVTYHPGHGRKVQILDGKGFVRFPVYVFKRMMHTLREITCS